MLEGAFAIFAVDVDVSAVSFIPLGDPGIRDLRGTGVGWRLILAKPFALIVVRHGGVSFRAAGDFEIDTWGLQVQVGSRRVQVAGLETKEADCNEQQEKNEV
jgi:hypothetical protein